MVNPIANTMTIMTILFYRTASWFRIASPLLRWCLVAAWYAVIFTLSHIPASRSASTQEMVGGDDTLNTLFRFCAHLAVFGVLGVLVYAALERGFVFRGIALALVYV
jgi:hypothetical protein